MLLDLMPLVTLLESVRVNVRVRDLMTAVGCYWTCCIMPLLTLLDSLRVNIRVRDLVAAVGCYWTCCIMSLMSHLDSLRVSVRVRMKSFNYESSCGLLFNPIILPIPCIHHLNSVTWNDVMKTRSNHARHYNNN